MTGIGFPILSFFLVSALCSDAAAQWKAGVARVRITPDQPLWMAGYGARTKPSEGTAQELHAKALALEDNTGQRAVLVTTDMLGFPRSLSVKITARAKKQYKLPRNRVLLNSSHTHAGPVVGRMLAAAYPRMTEQHWADVEAYTRELEDKIVEVIGQALDDLVPARLGFGRTKAGFAVNRRVRTPEGYRGGGVNWEGPVDHDVPILRIEGEDGKLRAVVFGYACHNTAIGSDFYEFHGGWSGSAQQWLEKRHPSAAALFVTGCGADANPYPRPGVEFAEMHGVALAAMVDGALERSFKPIHGPLKAAYEEFSVAFATLPSRDEFEAMLREGNEYQKFHANEMLKVLDREGRLPTEYPYPVQVWQFGKDLTLIALAGEVVVDYALRLKKELGAEKLWVAGYSNDVFGYIPSLRVLQEGGYEGGGAILYYMQPGPFTPSIEETIIRKVHELVKRTK